MIPRIKYEGAKCLSVPDAALKYGLGRQTVRNKAKEWGALIQIGKIVRVDVPAFEEGLKRFIVK